MTDLVYHFTDTARLPWILTSGELRPGGNRIGPFPDPDFLWATTSPIGDRTASASLDALRSGLTRTVRFTLRESDFETWPAIVTRFPAWAPPMVARLERAALGKSSPQNWRCRAEPLPTEAWIGIETRSYTDNTWRPLDLRHEPAVVDAETIGVEIAGSVYFSRRCDHPSGADAYQVFVGEIARAG